MPNEVRETMTREPEAHRVLDVLAELAARSLDARRLADTILPTLATHAPRAAHLHALLRALDERLAHALDEAAEPAAGDGARREEEFVELLVAGSHAPLRVTAEVADAVWNTMFVKESTLFVDVALAEGGVARIRPSAVTGFLFHPGTPVPERAPRRRG